MFRGRVQTLGIFVFLTIENAEHDMHEVQCMRGVEDGKLPPFTGPDTEFKPQYRSFYILRENHVHRGLKRLKVVRDTHLTQ